MSAGPIVERNQGKLVMSVMLIFLDATIYIGGLDEKVNEALLWELMVQAGPVASVNMPKDRVTANHQGSVSVSNNFMLCKCYAIINL